MCNSNMYIGKSKWYKFSNVIFNVKQFFPRLIEKIQIWALRLAIKYIKWHAINIQHSNYISHAQKEFDIAFNTCWKPKEDDPDGDEMQHYMCNQVLELLALLSTHGDSGSSIGIKLSMFNRLTNFGTIAPLTFADDEFNDVSLSNCAQNKRNSAVFKEDNQFKYINAVSKRPTYYIGDELTIIKNVKSYCMSGNTFIVHPDKSVSYVSTNGIIKDTKTFNSQKFEIPIYEIEYPTGWWISLAKEEDFAIAKEIYDFKVFDDKNYLEEEISWKHGVYKDEILKRIEAIKQHMYPELNDISSK